MFLAIRGLRTLAVRLAQHHRSGLEMARWLAAPRSRQGAAPRAGKRSRPRDLETGFYRRLRPVQHRPETGAARAVDALLDTLKLFGMGYSWGGFESLVIPFDCAGYRTATKWAPGGPSLRLHIGLENVEDLKADLARGFAAFNAA